MDRVKDKPLRGHWRWTSIVAILCLCPQALNAHDGKPHVAHDLIYTWGMDPFVIASLTLTAGLYYLGVVFLWREARSGHGIKHWEMLSFTGGWLTLVIALVSPLHPLGEVLFSAHMTQHELLMLVAAPLLVLGRPLVAFLWALPIGWTKRLGQFSKLNWFQHAWRTITLPLVAWSVHAVALWLWHVPVLFQATLRSDVVHTSQHLCFFGSALLFWWSLIHGPRGAIGYGSAALYLFTTSL
ncbi:MAG: hypothetical protein DMF69_04720, partial [Acidobacteria bacterium]